MEEIDQKAAMEGFRDVCTYYTHATTSNYFLIFQFRCRSEKVRQLLVLFHG